MDKTSYANLARAWEYVEDHAYSRQTQALLDAREQAAQCGLAQVPQLRRSCCIRWHA